jgi:[ribosomal protein S18]-alanine N-acetyltransferase
MIPPSLALPKDVRAQDRDLDFVPMEADLLPLVAEVEKTAYAHPWGLRHLQDSLAAGHLMQMLVTPFDPVRDPATWATAPTLPDGRKLLGYLVAMLGVDEVHLLNITTVPLHQRQGWARLMLEALAAWTLLQGRSWLWLEVRAGNHAARALYGHCGFQQVGLRRDYYPDTDRRREDAVVMSLHLPGPAPRPGAPFPTVEEAAR